MAQNNIKPVKCSSCGQINPSGSSFCQWCGAKMEVKTCPECGEVLNPDDKFCENCGAAVNNLNNQSTAEERTQQIPAFNSNQNNYNSRHTPKQISKEEFEQNKAEFYNDYDGSYNNENRTTKEKSSKTSVIVMGIEIFIIIAGLILSFNLLTDKLSEVSIAENYFVNIVNGNYNDAYKLLDVKDSEFVNSVTFESACRQNKDFTQLKRYDAKENGKENDTADVQITCTYADGTNEFMPFAMKSTGSKFLIFKDWKIDSSSMITSNYKITVNKGEEVSIDGIKVSDKYIDTVNSDETVTTYIIPEIFSGVHQITVNNQNKIVNIGSES